MTHKRQDDFGAKSTLEVGGRSVVYYRLNKLEEDGIAAVSKLPFSIKILLEAMLRNNDGFAVTRADVENMARWNAAKPEPIEVPFKPARVILQDFTGVPAVVDLAAMRSAMAQLGGDPQVINPLVPVDLVIDHSVQVDQFGSKMALFYNAEREFERNVERYEFLKWGQKAFDNFSVVPPETGIVHQVNLEYLAKVVQVYIEQGEAVALPDSLVGTDSHTTMINGLGVLGWGVGGIEAEAVMLGQPIYMLMPEVIGFKVSGQLPEGATATDLALTITEMLRKKGVVGKFVEFYGPGIANMALADRATIANMAPEYGATMGFFPVDAETLNYLRSTGRSAEQVELVEAYCKAQGLFLDANSPESEYSDTLHLDLSTVVPSVAGPKRPQDRVQLNANKAAFEHALVAPIAERGFALKPEAVARTATVKDNGHSSTITHGAVVIAAITSCTNTSNPSVMLGAGLLAKKAQERGLKVAAHVKTSLAPGSRVVTSYLEQAGLMPALESLGFHTVGYGCTTCIAAGTPVLLANGTTRRIEQLPSAGGAVVFGPTAAGKLGMALQAELMDQGVRDCVALVLQDGRELVCTPDHQVLCADGRWVRADQLVLGQDRVIVGLEAPLDEPGADEVGYVLTAGSLNFSMNTPQERLRTLAFGRLLGHLLSDGSISAAGQGRMNVGQAVDREMVLNDIELLTGKRPAGTQYDERKWSIALPMELTNAVVTLSGVRVGRRIDQPATLPDFILDPACPVALLREFLGGVFGGDGHAPTLHRLSDRDDDAVLESPAFSQSAKADNVAQQKVMMHQLIDLLARCGVMTDGAIVNEFPVRHAASSYPAAQDEPRIEVRLKLPDGLSFVEQVGFRYSVDKMMRSSAAAVYWRTIKSISNQRLWMSSRLEELHQEQPERSFSQTRLVAAAELNQRETVIFPHYSLLEGSDLFSRLPQPTNRTFQPLHRDSCEFPSPVALFKQMGVRDWFAPLQARGEERAAKRYCVDKADLELPTFNLAVLDRRSAGQRAVFDIAVDEVHAFVAGTIAVHNCIGNSGPLPEPVAAAVQEGELVAAAVLSGNRNFEGRINPLVKASYLMSPPLVVAYALAGTVDIDLATEALGTGSDGNPVYLRDIWPTQQEIRDAIHQAVLPEMFIEQYANVAEGNESWNRIAIPEGKIYDWNNASTYIQHPPFFQNLTPKPAPIGDITGARVLALLGDSVTTDHISPAGSIAVNSPAGKYLIEHGVEPKEFNSYGARRGSHEVMMRGTFANIRLKNMLLDGVEGGVTNYLPTGEQMAIYDAAMLYQASNTGLVILAGKEYGTGSSRDWAAKGTYLLGVKAVIAESFERIHRSNLVGMGVLPLQFCAGESWQTLGIQGDETFTIEGINADLQPRSEVTVRARRADGSALAFQATVRIDTPVEIEYYQNGGILHTVLRQLAKTA